MHDTEGDDPDYAEAYEEGCWTAIAERSARADEETWAYDSSEGHHGEVAILETSFDTAVRVDDLGVADGIVVAGRWRDGIVLAGGRGFGLAAWKAEHLFGMKQGDE